MTALDRLAELVAGQKRDALAANLSGLLTTCRGLDGAVLNMLVNVAGELIAVALAAMAEKRMEHVTVVPLRCSFDACPHCAMVTALVGLNVKLEGMKS